MKAIADLQMRVEEISGELDEIREGFSEEESEAYLDSEKENTFDKKAIIAGAKAKKDEVEAETKEKLKKIVKLWEEQKNKNKQIKEADSYRQNGRSDREPFRRRKFSVLAQKMDWPDCQRY